MKKKRIKYKRREDTKVGRKEKLRETEQKGREKDENSEPAEAKRIQGKLDSSKECEIRENAGCIPVRKTSRME